MCYYIILYYVISYYIILYCIISIYICHIKSHISSHISQGIFMDIPYITDGIAGITHFPGPSGAAAAIAGIAAGLWAGCEKVIGRRTMWLERCFLYW